MDLEQIDVLESKINQAIALIERLRLENEELKRSHERLRAEAEAKERTIEQLREENAQLQALRNQSSLGTEKEEKIRSKIEMMLAKLDELQFSL